jgi:hypothetical protein
MSIFKTLAVAVAIPPIAPAIPRLLAIGKITSFIKLLVESTILFSEF